MKKYALYTRIYDKQSSKREAINQVEAQSIKEAIEYFSQLKRIQIDVMLKIFEVKEAH